MSIAFYERYPVPAEAIEHPWRRDIQVGTTAMTTTGGHLWNAAERLADYMEAESRSLGLNRAGIDILELGSGVGWLGMYLAANLHQANTVTCSEQESGGAMEWLHENIDKNAHLDLSKLRCRACDWSWFDSNCPGDTSQAGNSSPRQSTSPSGSPAVLPGVSDPPELPASGASGAIAWAVKTCEVMFTGRFSEDQCIRPDTRAQWDYIVGSDLVYNEAGCRLLPRVIAQLASPDTVVLYAHTKRRFEMLDCDFFSNLRSEGLAVEEVKERWAPDPPPSPTAFESVFPDMRIAVFRIRLCKQEES
eukprot:jgi/Ulvmu1/10148/UM006_0102.1